MPTDVVMPQMGESIFEGTITKWLKKPGDNVQRDDRSSRSPPTRSTPRFLRPAAGVLKEIKIGRGTTVQINTVVAVIDAPAQPLPRHPASPPSTGRSTPRADSRHATAVDAPDRRRSQPGRKPSPAARRTVPSQAAPAPKS